MLLNDFRIEFVERLVVFLWKQWAQLGLASASVEIRDGWVIDPEGLLLLSATYARYDPRLFDEVIDWLNQNANFINVPRLKSLIRRYDFQNGAVVAALGSVVKERNSSLRWSFPNPEEPKGAEILFWNADGKSLADFGNPDEIFLRHGFKRGRLKLRGLSRRFNPVMPECALLRIRALFGISARAEIMLYLLTHEMAHPSGIARETGFSQKNVQDTLVDMAASGFVHAAQLEGRKKSYFIRKNHRAPFLYQSGRPPRWVTWPPLFRGFELLHSVLRNLGVTAMSRRLQASELRILSSQLRSLFARSGFNDTLSSESAFPGEGFIEVFVQDVRKLLTELSEHGKEA
jgi:hypothetical protein